MINAVLSLSPSPQTGSANAAPPSPDAAADGQACFAQWLDASVAAQAPGSEGAANAAARPPAAPGPNPAPGTPTPVGGAGAGVSNDDSGPEPVAATDPQQKQEPDPTLPAGDASAFLASLAALRPAEPSVPPVQDTASGSAEAAGPGAAAAAAAAAATGKSRGADVTAFVAQALATALPARQPGAGGVPGERSADAATTAAAAAPGEGLRAVRASSGVAAPGSPRTAAARPTPSSTASSATPGAPDPDDQAPWLVRAGLPPPLKPVAASAANPAAAAPGQNPAPDPAPLLAAADLNPPGAVVAPAADALPLLAALPANAAAPDGTAPVAEAKLNAPPGSADFARELGARLSTFVRDGVEHARLELNPQAMGPVTVQIQLEGANAQVSLSAEHAATRRALEQALPQLAATLREAGLMLSGGGVFEQQRPPQEGRDNTGHTGTARGTARAGSAGEAAVPGVAAGAWPPRSRGVVDLVA